MKVSQSTSRNDSKNQPSGSNVNTSGPNCTTNTNTKAKESDTDAVYKAYLNMIEVESGNESITVDDELEAAMQASLVTHAREEISQSTINIEPSDLLKEFVDSLEKSELYANIVISRRNILSSTIRAMDRGEFSFLQPVNITFSGEDGVDSGGPKREYF